jgi:hypothetical protein
VDEGALRHEIRAGAFLLADCSVLRSHGMMRHPLG